MTRRLPTPARPQLAAGGRRSVGRRLVEDDRQAGDLAGADAEVAGHDELVGQAGLVVGAVVAGPHDDVAEVVDDLADLHGDVVADELPGHEGPDGVGAPDLAAVVVDVGAGGEGGDDPLGIEGVDRGDVLGDDAIQLGAHWLLLLGVGPAGPARSTFAGAPAGGSTAVFALTLPSGETPNWG